MNRMHKFIRVVAVVVSLAMLSTMATGCGKMRMARHQQRADQYFADGDYSRAEVEYLNVRKFDRTNSHAIARLSVIYYEQGRLALAYPFLTKAVGLLTNDMDLRVKLGTINLSLGRSKEAHDAAIMVLDKSPTNSEAPILLAESVASPTEWDQAQKRLEALSKRIGETAPVELGLGQLDMRVNDLKGAETAFRRAQELDSKSAAVYVALGNLYTAQNKFKEAEEALKTASSLAEPRSPARMSYARFKIAHNDLTEAKQLLDEITKSTPDYVPAWLSEAEIALAEKKYGDCETFLSRVFAHDPENYDGLLMQGRIALIENHPDKAIAEFEHMATMYKQSAQVQFHLALARLTGGDGEGAIKSLNQALTIDPTYTDAIMTLARLNIQKGNVDAAITSLTELVRRQPQLVQAQMMLADAYVGQNRLADALAVYSGLEKEFPKSPQIPLAIGSILSQQNKLVEARQSLQKALALAPYFPAATEQLVNLDIKEKKFSAALDRVKTEMAEDTNGVATQLLLAQIHIARADDTARKAAPDSARQKLEDIPGVGEDVNLAEAELLKAIDLKPDLTRPYLLLTELYVSTGKKQEALDRLTKVAAKTNSAPILVEIGRINDALTNYPAAAQAYEKVLAINPNFVPALNNLAYLYSARLNQLDKAYPLAQRAQQLDPNDPSTADTLGWILYKRGEYSRALSLLNQSASKTGAAPEIQLHLGMTQYMMGDEDAARTSLEQVVKSTKDFPEKQEASHALAVLNTDVKTADAKSVAELENRLQSDPNDLVAAKRLAMIYERGGALDKAAKAYEQVLKVNPQNAQIMGRLSQLYLSQNDTGKALDMAKQAHTIAPDDGEISWMLGRLVYRSGDYVWALSLLQDSASKLRDRRDVLYDLAWSYYSVGRVTDAEASMERALPALSGAALDDAKRFLAMVDALKTPIAADVATQASQVLSTNAGYVPAIMVLAVQQEQEGKYEDAKKSYEKALAGLPAFSLAARNLAVICAQHPGDDQRAYDAGMKARTAFPDDTSLASALGLLAYRRGDYSQAALLLKESSQKVTNDGRLLYYLGKADYQLKQKQESKEALQRALTLNLESDLAADARKVLAELK